MQISEYEMSRVLFGQPPAKQLSARQLVDLQERPAITVALAVRRDGGTVKRFEKKVQTLSRLEAEIEAKKAARAEAGQSGVCWTLQRVAPRRGSSHEPNQLEDHRGGQPNWNEAPKGATHYDTKYEISAARLATGQNLTGSFSKITSRKRGDMQADH